VLSRAYSTGSRSARFPGGRRYRRGYPRGGHGHEREPRGAQRRKTHRARASRAAGGAMSGAARGSRSRRVFAPCVLGLPAAYAQEGASHADADPWGIDELDEAAPTWLEQARDHALDLGLLAAFVVFALMRFGGLG